MSIEETILCPRPRCKGEPMIHKDLDFYKCPNCGGEFWPPDEAPFDPRAVREVYLSEVRIPHKGGGGSSGRSRKKPPKGTFRAAPFITLNDKKN